MSARTRALGLAAAVVVVAVVVVIVGRAERNSERQKNLDGIAAVRTLVGSRIDRPIDYRTPPGLSCLIYRSGARAFALELCSDPGGRVVEAVDRRGSLPRFYSITSEPDRATLTMPPQKVQRLIKGIIRRAQKGH
ncbi:MAG: hypothetical protein HOQ28_01135 [Thermoleophilia bacterium]|nr:hypothetical protein [Thermoleophilia bacterium]